jgi:hypothetical protein
MTSILYGIASILMIIALTAVQVPAAVEDNVAHDFGPLAGYVIMQENGEFVIDLDASRGTRLGDIFAVVGSGKEIVHPVSKKVLGKLETVKGILKVTRMDTNFSFTRALDGAPAIKRGDAIRRYALLPAIFWDYTGNGQSFFVRLQKALPDFKWQDYNSAQKSRPPQPSANSETRNSITFILTDDNLEVRDPEFYVLKSYEITESLSSATVAPAIAPVTPKPSREAPAPRETAADKTVMPAFSEAQTIANIPNPSIITDFIESDGQLLMASTDGAQIQIFDVSEKLKPIASGNPSHPVRILSLKWWSPDNGHGLYLAANVWSDRDENVRGELFLLDGKRLRLKVREIPRILGTFDLNKDGKPETLMGQQFAGETFFGRRLNELKLNDNQLDYFKPKKEFPRHFTVLGSVFADLTGDGQLETAFIRNRILYIYSGKKRLYESPKQLGGSLSFLTYEVDPDFKDGPTTTIEFEVSPVAKDIDGDGQPELLAIASERSIFGSMAISPGIKKSWLAVFKYKNGRFESGSLGDKFDIPLQGLTVTRKRVLMVATQPGKLLASDAKSHLLAYSLAR